MANRIHKTTITEITMSCAAAGDPPDIEFKFWRLRYNTEGGGRFLVLSNENSGQEFCFHSLEEIEQIAAEARKLWEQGYIYHAGEQV